MPWDLCKGTEQVKRIGDHKRIARDRAEKLKPKLSEAKMHERWREKVYERDNHECQLCGGGYAEGKHLNPHHCMRKKSVRMRYSVLNGVTLCVGCHLQGVHSADMEVAQRFITRLRARIGEERWNTLLIMRENKEPMPLIEAWEELQR